MVRGTDWEGRAGCHGKQGMPSVTTGGSPGSEGQNRGVGGQIGVGRNAHIYSLSYTMAWTFFSSCKGSDR